VLAKKDIFIKTLSI